jgi:hypothetical protein
MCGFCPYSYHTILSRYFANCWITAWERHFSVHGAELDQIQKFTSMWAPWSNVKNRHRQVYNDVMKELGLFTRAYNFAYGGNKNGPLNTSGHPVHYAPPALAAFLALYARFSYGPRCSSGSPSHLASNSPKPIIP